MVETAATRALRRAVFLDRDGVLNRAIVKNGRPYPPQTPEDFELLPGVAGAVESLRNHGYLTIVVTNQPDVARGTQSRAAVDALNRLLVEGTKVDEVIVCDHADEDGCDCRKPKPGMLLDAARRWNIDLAASFMIGDRWRDIEAGAAAGCRTIFIDYGYAEPRGKAWQVVDSLVAAMPYLLAENCGDRHDDSGVAAR